MLVKTEAVILKSMKYRETSKIVTAFTREFGRLNVIAKGARQSRNKFGSALEPLSHVGLVLYMKPTTDLHLLSQADIIEQHGRINDNLEKMAMAFSVAELLYRQTPEGEQNEDLFRLTVETLKGIERCSGEGRLVLSAFQLRFAALFGFGPVLDVCVECGKVIGEVHNGKTLGFQISHGAAICASCVERDDGNGWRGHRSGALSGIAGMWKISAATYRILAQMLTDDPGTFATVACSMATGNEIEETLRLYLRHHFEGMKPLQSVRMFHHVIKGS